MTRQIRGTRIFYRPSFSVWLSSGLGLLLLLSAAATNASVLYGLVSTGQIFTSEDAGVNWQVQSVLAVTDAVALVASEQVTDLTLVTRSGLIYQSSDAGINWLLVGSASAPNVVDMVLLPSGNLLLLTTAGQVLTSTNSGVTWQTQGTVNAIGCVSLLHIPEVGTFALTRTGEVNFSDDEGQNWVTIAALPIINAIAVRNLDQAIFILAGSGQVFRSNDNGYTFSLVGTLSQMGMCALVQTEDGLVAGSAAGQVAVSVDGISWQWAGTINQVWLTALASSVTCTHEVIHVPADQPTIQAGINAAASGDTVVVACGTYHEYNLSVGAGVVLRSETGLPDCVTIDAQQLGRIFDCRDVANTAYITGFTVTGSYVASSGGGGIFINSTFVVRNCIFIDNNVSNSGGALYISGSDLIIEDCVIANNTSNYGGGLASNDSAVLLQNCIFSDNTAIYGGGAIRLNLTPAQFIHCTFNGNVSSSRGAIFCYDDSDPTISYCTFYGNSCANGNGVISALGASTPQIDHCIIAFTTNGSAISCGTDTIVLQYCDLFGNAGGDWVGCITSQGEIDGNISEDPWFCDAAGGDFQIYYDSPCTAENSGYGLIGAWAAACSVNPTENVIGLYFDTSATQQALNVNPFQLFSVYLILSNATDVSGVRGWECTVPVPNGVQLMGSPTLYNLDLNVGSAPEYIVSLDPTLPWSDNIVLAKFTFMAINADQHDFYVTGIDPEKSSLSAPAYLPGDTGNDLVVMTPSSGWYSLPVAVINPELSQGDARLPSVIVLEACYPNPFNPYTNIVFSLLEERPVRLEVYDLQGRLVRLLVDELAIGVGRHEVIWRGVDDFDRKVASGVYFYRLKSGGLTKTKAMTLVK